MYQPEFFIENRIEYAKISAVIFGTILAQTFCIILFTHQSYEKLNILIIQSTLINKHTTNLTAISENISPS